MIMTEEGSQIVDSMSTISYKIFLIIIAGEECTICSWDEKEVYKQIWRVCMLQCNINIQYYWYILPFQCQDLLKQKIMEKAVGL